MLNNKIRDAEQFSPISQDLRSIDSKKRALSLSTNDNYANSNSFSKNESSSEIFFDEIELGHEQNVQEMLKKYKDNIIALLNYKYYISSILFLFSYHVGINFNGPLCIWQFQKILQIEYIANWKTSMGLTPLHLAAQHDNIIIVQKLLEININWLNDQDQDFKTPLHYAAEYGRYIIINFILQNYFPKINLNLADKFRQNCIETFIYHIQKNNINSIKFNSYYKIIPDSEKNVLFGVNRNQYIQNFLLFQKKQEKIRKQNLMKLNKGVKFEVQNQIIDSDSLLFKCQKNLKSRDFIFYSQIGQGSFGKVYLVKKRNSKKNMLYALKVMDKDKIYQNNFVKYAQIEKDILALMKSIFLIKLYYSFQNREQLFLVMEYAEGGNLNEYLDQKQQLQEEEAKIILAELILAIEFLHNQNIIYRDLKPDNILLTETGHVKLADFGLSKNIQDKSNYKSNTFCGSLAYMAPEMILQSGHGMSIDWYLLGVTFYEMLVGQPPYYSNIKEELYENIKSSPLYIPSNLSKNCRDLIKRLMCRNPFKRLGAKHDSQEIKDHPFFEDIKWQDVYHQKIPNKYFQLFQSEKLLSKEMKIKFSGDEESPKKSNTLKSMEKYDMLLQLNQNKNCHQINEWSYMMTDTVLSNTVYSQNQIIN